jgi:hypothetical protein
MRFAISVLAAALLGAPAPAAAGEFNFTPYIWIPGINGTIGTGGGDTGLGDRVSLDFTPDFKIGGAMANFAWRQDRFMALGDWTYANVRVTSPSPFGALYSGVSGQFIGNVVQLFAGYTIFEGQGTTLDAFVGGRGYGVTCRLGFDAGAKPEASTSSNEVWFDAAVGLRFNALVVRHWVFHLRGDVGAGGSNFTWQGYAATGYQFSWGALLAGWRHLYIDKGEGPLQLKLALSGPVIGANFRF